MYRDILFHNQVREGTVIVLRKSSDFEVVTGDSTQEVTARRGTVFDVAKVFFNSFNKLVVLLKSSDLEIQLPINHVVDLFERVVPESELMHNQWATPFNEDKDYTGEVIEIYDEDFDFEALEAHCEEQARQEFLNETVNNNTQNNN
ncbi:hypothetical protein SP15_237 [Bacillus phage SP-15]|uniref:Uncharacterized protein n=1 Tax=Bacillus phage SP-15 TaxID=1792032 RepID=A0A127AWQ5_9CAUD|nr:hypothetical protein SP15_237 [Bacillus phage SP-15]AMM45040.1 hypothetical protein SP15_237 [Bacillus phage SP-15]